MKVAQVCFYEGMSNEISDKRYSYVTDIEDLDWEDIVVVETRYGLRTAIFMNYIESNSSAGKKAKAWVVQKVDLQDLDNKKAKMRELQEIKSKLLERKAMLEERTILEILAKDDAEMANLLNQYDQLNQ